MSRNLRTVRGRFVAECEKCGVTLWGATLLSHRCDAPAPEELASAYWHARYLIERRYARRLSFWLLVVATGALSAFIAGILGWPR
jgi:hypothetical protein